MEHPPEPPLAHNLGAFFGHIIDALRSEPDAAEAPRTSIQTRTHTQEERLPDGVLLRRTVIEEMFIPAVAPSAATHRADTSRADTSHADTSRPDATLADRSHQPCHGTAHANRS